MLPLNALLGLSPATPKEGIGQPDEPKRQMIESAPPSGWRKLQDNTARILTECGLEAHTVSRGIQFSPGMGVENSPAVARLVMD